MATKLLVKGNYLILEDTIDGSEIEYPKSSTYYRYYGNVIVFKTLQDLTLTVEREYSELLDENGNTWGSLDALKDWLQNNTGGILESGGSVPVLNQDPITPSFDLYFSEALGAPTTLTANAVIDERVISVADATNFYIPAGDNEGTWVGIFSGTGRYMWAEVIEINGNDLTLDRLIDYNFLSGSNVLPTSKNLAVDGSVTPRVFSIQAGNTDLEIDVTRLIYSMITTNPLELALFGDQPKLTYGLLLREVNGEQRNLINTKTNYQIGVHSYDLTIYEQVKQNDVNALLARSTWAGSSKRGVVIRLKAGDELQLVVQDDLSNILNIWVLAQGHEVEK